MFRRKPANTRSDWHFTAFKDSSENFATFTRSIHYNLVLERSPSFGSNKSNLSITILIFNKLLKILGSYIKYKLIILKIIIVQSLSLGGLYLKIRGMILKSLSFSFFFFFFIHFPCYSY